MSVLFYEGVDHMIEKITALIKGKANNSHKHTKSDITDFPSLGTASEKDVASSGNASASQVVMGNDTRLSDARKASDVSAWAKSSTKPNYTKSEVGLGNVDNTADSAKSVKYATSAGSASSASKATGVVDYGSTAKTIQIGYGGDGISGDAIKFIAGYTTGNGSDVNAKIKDVSKDALKSWLGLGSLAYSSATIPTIPSSLPANGGNSTTVNGHTVNSDVPSGAKFTDTNTWRPQPDWNATSGDAVIKNKPASMPANGGNADHATRLVCAETRPTSANKASSSDRVGMMEMFIASSSMKTGKPDSDAKILQMNWDNTSGWDSQLAMLNDGTLQHRSMSSGTWKNWKTVLDNNTGDWTPRMFDTASNEVRVGAAFGQYYVLGDMVFIDAILGIDGGCACHHISGLPYKPESNRPSNVYPIGIASSSKGTNSPFNHISGSDSWYVQNDAHASRDISDTWYVYGWYRKG